MVNTINMQDMRHLNLFSNITKVPTRFCFKYSDTIFFCVPMKSLQKALGENASNIKRLSQMMGKRVRVIPKPNGIEDARRFIELIVSPSVFKDFEIRGNEIIITAGGTQNKANLMGRNKVKLSEIQKVSMDFFEKELKII